MRRLLLSLVVLTACNPIEPLDEFQSDIAIMVVDTQGVEMGQRDFSVERRRYEDALIRIWPADTTMADTNEAPQYDGCGAIRVRGSSSLEYDKRNFRLELRTKSGADLDARLLGMTEDADWILSGPFSDKSLIRNALIYSLSRDIGRWAPRTRPLELFVVDDSRPWNMEHYRGVYMLTERIERHSHRVDVARLRPDDPERKLSGGYILKRDWLDDVDEEKILTTSVYDDDLIVEYPASLTEPQRDYLSDFFAQMEESLGVGEQSYANFIDLDSFVDHMLLAELGRSVDAYVLSTWMYKQRNAPLSMGPIWDYNGALGNADYFEAWKTDGWHYENPEFPEDNPNGFSWYEQLLEDETFLERRAERWRLHRADVWSDEALNARVDELAAELGTDPVARNFERWEGLGEVIWPNPESAEDRETHEEEVEYLRDWLLARAAWMDGEL